MLLLKNRFATVDSTLLWKNVAKLDRRSGLPSLSTRFRGTAVITELVLVILIAHRLIVRGFIILVLGCFEFPL